MYRLAYRNFGPYGSLVMIHDVDVDNTIHSGVRWTELRKDSGSGSWTIFQEGTYAPDAANRWMGSVAMDHLGDIALGYSAGSSTTYPSIRFTGRAPSDPAGILQPETTMVAGSGSQTGPARWGDYSHMSVDPSDDCTFWYTSEYYKATSTKYWSTRIGSFKFPGCVPLAPSP